MQTWKLHKHGFANAVIYCRKTISVTFRCCPPARDGILGTLGNFFYTLKLVVGYGGRGGESCPRQCVVGCTGDHSSRPVYRPTPACRKTGRSCRHVINIQYSTGISTGHKGIWTMSAHRSLKQQQHQQQVCISTITVLRHNRLFCFLFIYCLFFCLPIPASIRSQEKDILLARRLKKARSFYPPCYW